MGRKDMPFPGTTQPTPAPRKDTPFPGAPPAHKQMPPFTMNNHTPTASTGFTPPDFAATNTKNLVDTPTPGFGSSAPNHQETVLPTAIHNNGTVLPEPTKAATVNDSMPPPPPRPPMKDVPFDETWDALTKMLQDFDDADGSLQHKLLEANVDLDTAISELLELEASSLDFLSDLEDLSLSAASAVQAAVVEL